MCSHYDPQTDPARLKSHFGVTGLPLGLKPSLWPGYQGPFLRKHEFADVGDDAVPLRELLVGSFGLIPHWSRDATIARRTYNARSETVHEKPSYRDAWHLARHCIIPAEAIYEPDWRTGIGIATLIAGLEQNFKAIVKADPGTGQFRQTAQSLRSYRKHSELD